MSIRVVIVDDEPLARRGIRARLRAFPEFTIVEECADGPAAVAAVQKLSPDLMFLDVQMPGMSGFDVLRRLSPGPMPSVIFLTAYDRYALQAFDVHALDYLLKPIDEDRFSSAIVRARRQIELQNAGELGEQLKTFLAEHAAQAKRIGHAEPIIHAEGSIPAKRSIHAARSSHAERFAIRKGSRIVFVLADEIDWIGAAGDYAALHVGKATHLLRETLNALESRLDPARFVRIHRSTIVQAARIRELHGLPNREFRVRLADGTELKASRSYRDRLSPWLS
ncbi:MAG TPA: LytTR family DNA-binding domain-containing protein [Candidatus Angelobacter sp.]|nr:LytTR family DNA-binding domain-containing protein [Candidatus Angelobacter sp.]